jgi:putative membrane protein
MMNGSDGMAYGGFWLMLVFALIFAVLIGVAVYVVLRTVNQQQTATSAGTVEPHVPSPLEVLDLRLARGEISPEEYGTIRPLLDPVSTT